MNNVLRIAQWITGKHVVRIVIALWWAIGGIVVLVAGLALFPLFLESANVSATTGLGLNIYVLWVLGTFLWMFMKGFLKLFRKDS